MDKLFVCFKLRDYDMLLFWAITISFLKLFYDINPLFVFMMPIGNVKGMDNHFTMCRFNEFACDVVMFHYLSSKK